MLSLLLLLALQAEPPPEVADLLRMLNSDVASERERAATQLKKIGPSVIPALQELMKTGEVEARERARDLLATFERLERLRSMRPSERRVTAKLEDVPLEYAKEKLLAPFGMTKLKAPVSMSGRKVTLSVENASFWEALEQLEKSAGVRTDLRSGLLVAPSEAGVRSGSGDVRVTSNGWGTHVRSGEQRWKSVFFRAWLPPGSWICFSELENLTATSDSGKLVETQWDPRLESIRKEGLPSEVEVGLALILPKDLKGLKSVTFTGTLRLGFPRDLERLVMDAIPGELKTQGCTIKIQRLEMKDGEWHLGLDAEGGPEILRTLLGVEDQSGRWLGDLMTLTLRPGQSIGTSRGVDLGDGTPARCIAHRALGTDLIEMPFTLTQSVGN